MSYRTAFLIVFTILVIMVVPLPVVVVVAVSLWLLNAWCGLFPEESKYEGVH